MHYFDNIDKTLMKIALYNLIISGIVGLFVWLFMLKFTFMGQEIHLGFPGFFLGILIFGQGSFNSFLLFGFGKLIENTNAIKESSEVIQNNIKLTEQDKIAIAKEKQAKIDQENENQKRLEEQRQMKALQIEKAREEKRERINKYWQEHFEEKNALLKKKAEAEQALESMNATNPSREKLLSLISSINNELEKDR